MTNVVQRIDEFIAACNSDPAYSGSWHAGLELNEIRQQWEKERPAYEFPEMKQCYEKGKYVVESFSKPRKVVKFPIEKTSPNPNQHQIDKKSITSASVVFWLISAVAMYFAYMLGSMSLVNSTSFLFLLCVVAAILADRPVSVIIVAGGLCSFFIGTVASPYSGTNAPRIFVVCGLITLGTLWIWLTIMCISTKSVYQSFKEIVLKQA